MLQLFWASSGAVVGCRLLRCVLSFERSRASPHPGFPPGHVLLDAFFFFVVLKLQLQLPPLLLPLLLLPYFCHCHLIVLPIVTYPPFSPAKARPRGIRLVMGPFARPAKL